MGSVCKYSNISEKPERENEDVSQHVPLPQHVLSIYGCPLPVLGVFNKTEAVAVTKTAMIPVQRYGVSCSLSVIGATLTSFGELAKSTLRLRLRDGRKHTAVTATTKAKQQGIDDDVKAREGRDNRSRRKGVAGHVEDWSNNKVEFKSDGIACLA